MSELKKEFKSFMDDIEKNINNSEDLEYIKDRVTKLFGVILEEMQKVTNLKEEKMELMLQKQQEIENKMNKMEQIINKIENDIYLDEGFDFEIVCPYCNAEFVVDMDDDKTEVNCPECNNVIELDWSGDLDEELACSADGCAHCHGCDSENEDQYEDDDM